MRRRSGVVATRCALLAVALTFGLVLAGGAGAATYPTPLPDFAHRTDPHTPVFSVRGGQEDRPMLVVYARWDDVDYPSTAPLSMVVNGYFGPNPSVSDFFFRTSFGDLILSPAAETQGTANDGVVQVWIPGTKAAFFGPGVSDTQRNRIMLQAADPFVDFASFDRNGNGSLERFELLLNTLEANPAPVGTGSGIARGVASLTLDGVGFGSQTVATDGTHTALGTIIHENGHAALDTLDLYRFGIGSMDFAATGGAPSAWQKLHWGWIEPTVVVRDGFYDIPLAYYGGPAFLLYDPDRGPEDYFLVENRRRIAGTYDSNVADDGLAIYRVDERQFGKADNNLRPLELLKPDGVQIPAATQDFTYFGSQQDAWDPADPATPQRTMALPWRDGTPANVAVRAIRRVGASFRAYLDVRGPGVLVDTYDLDVAAPPRITAGVSNSITVPVVMNTDEGTGCDTFKVSVDSLYLPVDWTTQAGARVLCAGEQGPVLLRLTPPANAPLGIYSITVTGRSETNSSIIARDSFEVEVVPRRTRFGLEHLLTLAASGQLATFEVAVREADDPRVLPVVGTTVTFALSGAGGTQTFSVRTDGWGIATARQVLSLPPGEYELAITTGRLGAYGAASVTVPYTIQRRPRGL
jgi:M6 family metalloprotease-like protein